MNSLEGLKEGMSCAGTTTDVFFEIFRAVFSALCLIKKLPKPLNVTSSPLLTEFFTSSIKDSNITNADTLSTPVLELILFTRSAFVILPIFTTKF